MKPSLNTCCSLPFLVNNRKLRVVVRAVQDPDGDVGNIRCSSPDVGGPEDHQARLQSDPEK